MKSISAEVLDMVKKQIIDKDENYIFELLYGKYPRIMMKADFSYKETANAVEKLFRTVINDFSCEKEFKNWYILAMKSKSEVGSGGTWGLFDKILEEEYPIYWKFAQTIKTFG